MSHLFDTGGFTDGPHLPGRLVGEPIGAWAEGNEQELRLYRYRSVLNPSRMFAARQIGQVPTLSPVPPDAVFQNTALLLQKEGFPLNVWVVSRIVQFYCAKILRASIIEDITAHWYKRQLALLPVPESPSAELFAELEAKGEALFLADRTVADRYLAVQAAIEAGSKTLRDLIVAGDARTVGLDLTGVPTDDADVAELAVDGDIIRAGLFWSAVVPDQDLRHWLAHRVAREGQLSDQQFVRADLLNLAIPDDLTAALAALDVFEAADPEADFEDALSALDAVVGAALGLNEAQVAYFKDQMRHDAFLRHINPMWEKRGPSRQAYKDADPD